MLAACALAGASLTAFETAAAAQDLVEEQAAQIREIDRALGTGGNLQLSDLIIRANAVRAAIAECKTLECPEFNTCEQARQLDLDLERLIALLEQQLRYLEVAGQVHTDHFVTLVRNEIQTGESIADLTMAIAVQDTLIRFSDSLAQIATMIGSFETLLDPNSDALSLALDIAKLEYATSQLEGALDLSKNIARDPNSGFTRDDGAALAGSLAGALDKLRGAQAELKTAAARGAAAIRSQGFKVVARAPSAGQVVRGATMGFKAKPGPRAHSLLVEAGEIFQGVLSNYAKERLAERQKRMQNLVSSVVPAEAAARASSFQSLQKVQSRRWKTVDAIALLKQTQADLADCMGRAKCPPQTRTAPDLNLPDFGTTATGRERYGNALIYLLREVEKMRPKIRPVGLLDECPAEEDLVNFIPGEEPSDNDALRFWLPLLVAHDGTDYCESREGSPEVTGGMVYIPLEDRPTECPGGDETCGPATVPPEDEPTECPGGSETCAPGTVPEGFVPSECPGGVETCGPATLPVYDPSECEGGDLTCEPVVVAPVTEFPECSSGGYDCYIYEPVIPPGDVVSPVPAPISDPTFYVPNPLFTLGGADPSSAETDCERLEQAIKRYEELADEGPGDPPGLYWDRVNSLYMSIKTMAERCPSVSSEVVSPSAIGRRHEPQVPVADGRPILPNIPVDAFFKGKSRNPDEQARKEELKGQAVMLLDPSIELFALPDAKAQPTDFVFENALPDAKPQHAANLDPMKALTDENGDAKISIGLHDVAIKDLFYLDTDEAPGLADAIVPSVNDFDGDDVFDGDVLDLVEVNEENPAQLIMDLDVTTQDSVNVFIIDITPQDFLDGLTKMGDDAVSRLGQPLVNELVIGVGDDDAFNTADPVYTFTFDASFRPELDGLFQSVFGPSVFVETNNCREKKPLAPRPDGTFVAPPASAELRGATLALGALNREVSP